MLHAHVVEGEYRVAVIRKQRLPGSGLVQLLPAALQPAVLMAVSGAGRYAFSNSVERAESLLLDRPRIQYPVLPSTNGQNYQESSGNVLKVFGSFSKFWCNFFTKKKSLILTLNFYFKILIKIYIFK